MDYFELAANYAEKNQTVNNNDYTKDGLLYCGKCHTPKQVKIVWEDTIRTVACMCSCRKEEVDAQEQALKQRSRFLQIMPKYERYELNVPARKEHCDERVLRYIEKWPEMRQQNIGLLLYGDVGTGKSTSASYICKKLKEQNIPCLMTNFSTLVDTDRATPLLNELDLVVLDDLGAERQSDYMLEKIFSVVDNRVHAKKPMIFTTNLSVKEMRNPVEYKYKRLYDRLLAACVPVRFVGESYREKQAKEKLAETRKILFGK